LKNAIDWASRPYGDSAWNGNPAAIMGASIGTIETARAQYHLRQVFVFLNMFPVNQPEVMIGNASERFDADGNLTDGAAKDFIRQLLQNLVDWTRRIAPRVSRDVKTMKVALIGASGNVESGIEHGSAGCRKNWDGFGRKPDSRCGRYSLRIDT
jgi:NAD(P)H-dependent FMN reductase